MAIALQQRLACSTLWERDVYMRGTPEWIVLAPLTSL